MQSPAIVYIIDDDAAVRDLVEAILRDAGIESRAFENALGFSAFVIPDRPACILLDLEMPGLSGLELLEQRFADAPPCPVIVLTAHGSVRNAVDSMKLGAIDFLEKPFEREVLLQRVRHALDTDKTRRAALGSRAGIQRRLATLSPRERQLLATVIDGKSTKMIADEMRISARTVDHHRANLMEKMHAANVADLVRMAVEAGFNAKDEPPKS